MKVAHVRAVNQIGPAHDAKTLSLETTTKQVRTRKE